MHIHIQTNISNVSEYWYPKADASKFKEDRNEMIHGIVAFIWLTNQIQFGKLKSNHQSSNGDMLMDCEDNKKTPPYRSIIYIGIDI